MDKLERYLDQVCRGVGGPRELRQHVRQELREHLLDAAAGHKAAGLSEAEALERALADFGGPEEVRAGLEEAHGYRLLPVVIDKAMQWKERTMRAKWLWATWAHLALAGVLALELAWITFAVIFLVPKFRRLTQAGLIDPAVLEEHGVAWMGSFLGGLSYVGGHYTTWLLLAAVVACGLFEWRVRGENKSLIRLSAWGTLAAALMVPAVLTAGSLVVPYLLAAPTSGLVARSFATEQLADVATSSAAIEQALAKQDWGAVQEQTSRAEQALDRLAAAGPAVGSLTPHYGPPTLDEVRAQLKAASGYLAEARQAARDKDAGRAEAAVRRFRESYGPVAKAATRLSP
jgi:hypothetical protein